MGIRLVQKRKYSWPVYVNRPVNGKTETHEFTGHFVAMDRATIDAVAKGDMSADEAIRQHMVGWEGVTDDKDEPVSFSPESLDMAMEDPAVFAGILDAMMSASSGRASRKN